MVYDVITLVTETVRGAFDPPVETETQIYAVISTANRSEAYAAMAAGLNVDYVFFIAVPADYDGQKTAVYRGDRYRVVRAFENEAGLWLSVQKVRPGDTEVSP
jgi:SPP1 family predicted phage head-tail adaptor